MSNFKFFAILDVPLGFGGPVLWDLADFGNQQILGVKAKVAIVAQWKFAHALCSRGTPNKGRKGARAKDCFRISVNTSASQVYVCPPF